MSEEWLKKLAELSNDKELLKRAQQMQKRSAAGRAGGSRRGLFAASLGFWFRILLLIGVVQAVAMFVVADTEGIGDESWGYIFYYTIWYGLTQPVLPPEIYQLLSSQIGVTAGDLAKLFDLIDPTLRSYQDILVFAAPAALALAVTLYFLPSINAARRRSPIRLIVYLMNLAAGPLFVSFSAAPLLWLGALVLSLAGRGGLRMALPTGVRAKTPAPQPARAAPPPARAATATAAAERPTAGPRREPAVARRGGGGSWIRPR
jgi:hypothetical protein